MAEKKEPIILLKAEKIEGRLIEAGAELGVMEGGTIKATAEGVTRGHIESRLRFRRAALKSDVEAAQKAKAEASKQTQAKSGEGSGGSGEGSGEGGK